MEAMMKIIIKSQLRSQRFRAAAAAVTLCAFRAQKCSKSTFLRKLYLMPEAQCLTLFSLFYFYDLKEEFLNKNMNFCSYVRRTTGNYQKEKLQRAR